MPRPKWICKNEVVREHHVISTKEYQQRLVETLKLLLEKKSQLKKNNSAFSIESTTNEILKPCLEKPKQRKSA